MIAAFDGVYHAVFDVVFQDHFGGVVDGGFDGGELDQDFAAVAAVFYHAFDGFHVTDGPGQAVQDGLGVLVGVGMSVTVTMRMSILMAVLMRMLFRVGVLIDGSIRRYMGVCMGMFTHFFVLFRSASTFSTEATALFLLFSSVYHTPC